MGEHKIIRQAVISAGGFGTRLRPATDTVPKPMLPVLGHPTLAWSVAQFKKHGVTEFFITLHYLPRVIMDYFGDGSKFGVKIHYITEEQPLGEAGAMKKIEPQLNTTFYYMYGDVLTLVDYLKMAAVFEKKIAQARGRGEREPIGIERVERTDSYVDADVAELDADGRFLAMHVKPHADTYPNAYRTRGSFILNKKILSYEPAAMHGEPAPDAILTLNKHLIPDAIAAGEHFYGYECGDFSKGFDTPEKWHEVEAYLKEHNIRFEDLYSENV